MNIRRAHLSAFVAVAVVLATACESLITTPSRYNTVTTEVKQRNGAPVPDALLVLYTGERAMAYASTDKNGRYTFEYVPDGVYGVRVAPPFHYRNITDLIGGVDSTFRDQIQLKSGDVRAVDFRLLKVGEGKLSVAIEDENKSAMPGVRVGIDNGTKILEEGVTNAMGRFTFATLPYGVYNVFAARPVAYRDSGESALPVQDNQVIDEGYDGTAVFRFARCVGSIEVRVRDNTGAGVPGSLLTFYGDLNTQDSVRGPEATRRLSDLACGSYGVRVRPPVGWTAVEAPGSAYRDSIRVRRGTTANVVLNLRRGESGTVRVRVIDNLDAPVANVRTVLYTSLGVIEDVVTDAQGNVTFPGVSTSVEYGVRVVPRTGYTAPEGPGSTYTDGIRVTAGGMRELIFRFRRN